MPEKELKSQGKFRQLLKASTLYLMQALHYILSLKRMNAVPTLAVE